MKNKSERSEQGKSFSTIRIIGTVIGVLGFLVFFVPRALSVTARSIGTVAGSVGCLVLTLYCLFQPAVHRFIRKMCRRKAIKAMLLAIAACVIAVALVMLSALTGILRYMFASEPVEDTVVVLGCMVRGEVPSLSLQYRIDTAYNCLTENPDAVCVVSGGQGKFENITEAECMRRELTKMGISEDRIVMEDRSTSTYENLTYSTELIEELGLSRRITVVTSNFHVFRGCLVARDCGLTASGRGSRTQWYLMPTYLVREACAVVHYHFWGY